MNHHIFWLVLSSCSNSQYTYSITIMLLNSYVSVPDREFGVLRKHNTKQYGTAHSWLVNYPYFPGKYNEIRESHEKSYI